MAASADRHLLFGLLAVQLDFISREQLIAAMNAWSLDKTKGLSDVLRDQRALNDDRLHLLTALVAEHIKQHGGDAQQSLAVLSSVESQTRQQLAAITDPDIQATLAQIGNGIETLAQLPSPTAGRYRILRSHARGGLGEVYVAEDTELGRNVALKEIQLCYAHDATSRARFILEAEITGGLEHPGVVPVYGLGTYADGRPFYAMRFIKGDNLKDAIAKFHADVPRFDSLVFRELLGRFIDVCNAVAYAHSRGVLHRDLKPGNVMLGKFGETLVVDWGLAKVNSSRERQRPEMTTEADPTLLPRSGDKSSGTIAGSALGTPVYMPPEQAEGRHDRLGPASDVYSLGATLYELLTGASAFHGTAAEVLEKVRHGDFLPPRILNATVPAALDAVCRKAMALDPARRYASPLDLANEIEHWLADEPVTAFAEPFGARARRWIRRHARLAAGMTTALAVGLIAFAVLAWQREQARLTLQGEQAQTSAQRDRAVAARNRTREALDAMTSEVTGETLAAQRALSQEQKKFLENVVKYYEEFAAEPGDDREGRVRLAQAVLRLGRIRFRLGQREQAVSLFRRASGLYVELSTELPAEPQFRHQLAVSHSYLALSMRHMGQLADAEAAHRAALALQEKLVAENPDTALFRQQLAGNQNNLGGLLSTLGRRGEDAEKSYRAAVALLEPLATGFPAVPQYRQELAASQNNLGILLRELGRRDGAAAAYRAAIALQGQLAAEFPAVPLYRQELAISHNNLAALMRFHGRPADVEADLRTAIALQAKLADEFPSVPEYRQELAGTHNNLANLMRGDGRRAEAETAFRAAVALQTKLVAEFSAVPQYQQDLAISHYNLANLLRDQGRHTDAEASFRAALAIMEKLAAGFPNVPLYKQRSVTIELNLSALLAISGNAPDAASRVERIAGDPELSAENLYICACTLSLAAAATNNFDSEKHARRAVDFLRQAVDKGVRDFAHILKDDALSAIRGRADFVELIWLWADLPAKP